MNLRQLKYFIATAELGQVSRASSELSISQSSITSAIRELEQDMGVTLFTRTAQGMDLTQTGRKLLGAARDVMEKVEIARDIGQGHSDVAGTINVAATYTVCGYFLPFHLDRLAHRFPNLTINISELNRESIEEGLISNRFDIAVILTSNTSNPELTTQTLLRSHRRLWVPQNHELANREQASFEDVAEQDYIMLTVDEAANTSMKYWGPTGLTPKIRMRTSSTEAVRSMVANGLGVTILSDMVYRPWSLEGRRIGTVVMEREIPSMDVGLAWRRNQDLPTSVRLFVDYFRDAYLSPQMANASRHG
ncbi:Morphology and auto-aggregation control protein [Thalassovita gelatinovora]|uniref:Morphology and auto-aggregation control protein n=1 Tax=Thalassovita gelatinovora TaxID=53501 RepID=A0A0P1FJQ2_THAGE|nr:LysR family transcriptional regulator [Thalassovita gelatinovora]QIZ81694.1 LysR family transcriptional regulator [Thalassovita gelatinovora]CUH68232.1 Morphology and auto-aggregation control protein [Thalassovita gelatinovora]SEQ31714.1 transcriptional regulator, LysR family [Thalassovita gelatinovora]